MADRGVPRAEGVGLSPGPTLGRLAGFIIEDQRAALRRRRAQTVSVGLDDDLDF